MMKRTFAKLVVIASLAGSAALVPALAGAQVGSTAGGDSTASGEAKHAHHPGPAMAVIHAALQIDSLTVQQRASIEALKKAEHEAVIPARAAQSRVLTALAAQVEAGNIDRGAIAPAVQAAEAADSSARAAARDTLQKLHDILTPAQRSELVSTIEAKMAAHENAASGEGGNAPAGQGHGGLLAHWSAKLGLSAEQQAQIAANLKSAADAQPPVAAQGQARRAERERWLESFRAGDFNANASALTPPHDMTVHIEDVLQAAVPVLTPAQRTQVATELRQRAAHRDHSHA